MGKIIGKTVLRTAHIPLTFSHYSVPHEGHPERNEDAIIADVRRGMAVVCDGVGGGEAGDVASRIATRVIHQRWQRVLQHVQLEQASPIPDEQEGFDPQIILPHLVVAAHDHIRVEGCRHVNKDGSPRRMETTIALAVFCRQRNGDGYTMTYAHAGDSRIYLLRAGEPLKRLTSDDGYFSLLLKDATITEADIVRIDQATCAEQLSETELGYFNKRNGITQSLGDKKSPSVHVDQIALSPNDRILLCSDGVHDNLTDQEIGEVLRKGARTTVAKALILRAIERSHEDKSQAIRAKKDDMSAVVITYSH